MVSHLFPLYPAKYDCYSQFSLIPRLKNIRRLPQKQHFHFQLRNSQLQIYCQQFLSVRPMDIPKIQIIIRSSIILYASFNYYLLLLYQAYHLGIFLYNTYNFVFNPTFKSKPLPIKNVILVISDSPSNISLKYQSFPKYSITNYYV